MGKTKRKFGVADFERAARNLEFLSKELLAFRDEMQKRGVSELLFFGDSLPHGIEFVKRFFKNAQIALTSERLSDGLESISHEKTSEKTSGLAEDIERISEKIIQEVKSRTKKTSKKPAK